MLTAAAASLPFVGSQVLAPSIPVAVLTFSFPCTFPAPHPPTCLVAAVHGCEDIGPDYAVTLRAWRQTWEERQAEVLALGYSQRFWRKYRFYFAYCEAGFDARSVLGVCVLPECAERRCSAESRSGGGLTHKAPPPPPIPALPLLAPAGTSTPTTLSGRKTRSPPSRPWRCSSPVSAISQPCFPTFQSPLLIFVLWGARCSMLPTCLRACSPTLPSVQSTSARDSASPTRAAWRAALSPPAPTL